MQVLAVSIETKVTDSNQTQVPAALREKFDVKPGDLVVWEERPNGEIVVRFRSRLTLWDLIGVADGSTAEFGGDAVEAKRRIQRGE